MAWAVAKHVCSERPQYDLQDAFFYNLRGKLQAISDALLHHDIFQAEFIFVRDEDSVRKIMLYPEYKANRNGSDLPINEALKFIKEKNVGRVCYSPMNEADDTIASLLDDNPAVIVSCDRDLWQLIELRKVGVLNPLTKKFITTADIQKAFQLEDPAHIVLHKALWGDAGDCVPNAMPRQQKALRPIVCVSNGTLESFTTGLRAAWSSLSQRCKDLWNENESQVQINYNLVRLHRYCPIVWED
jgi:hypothetical protein